MFDHPPDAVAEGDGAAGINQLQAADRASGSGVDFGEDNRNGDTVFLTVQRRFAAVAELMASEKDRVSVLSLMKALVTAGALVSLLALVTEVEKDARSVPSGFQEHRMIELFEIGVAETDRLVGFDAGGEG